MPAGVNIWLTCCISIDRFLIVYYHVNYPVKETKSRVIIKILAIIICHLIPGIFSNFVHYIPAAVNTPMNPLQYPPYTTKSLKPAIDSANDIVNVIRLIADRLVPWVLCPATYVAVFFLRNRQKNAVQQAPAKVGSVGAGAMEARQRAERRIRRSRKLVVGISASVFISLLPETVLDFSNYAVNIDLRGPAEYVGLIWYIPTITDPIICITSLSNLKRRTEKILDKIGCKCLISNQTQVMTFGATGGSVMGK